MAPRRGDPPGGQRWAPRRAARVVLGGDGFGVVPDAEGGRWRWPSAVGSPSRTTSRSGRIRPSTARPSTDPDPTGCQIDNQVQIAHNCDIGEDVLIAAQAGLSGNTVVGARAILMARSATTGHLTIGEGAFLAANTAVHHDVAPGARLYGAPAMEERGWHRTVAALKRLPELIKRVRRLERRLDGTGD